MYLACDYWRKKGILDKCDVHYISGASMIFGVKEYAETLEKLLIKYNIHTHYGANVTAINGETTTVEFETKEMDDNLKQKLSSENGASHGTIQDSSTPGLKKVTLNFDIAHVVPPQSAPDFIKNSPIRDQENPMGYVEVDKYTLQHSRFPNIFSLGDSSSAPASKTGAAIRKQAPVVVANLLAVMAKKTPTERYEGYSACPIPTEFGKLMLAEFDYSNTPKMTFPINQAKPNWLMWILKTKILPWLYWNKILKGTA